MNGVDRVVGGVDRVVGGVEIEYVEVIKENVSAHRPLSLNALAHRSLAQKKFVVDVRGGGGGVGFGGAGVGGFDGGIRLSSVGAAICHARFMCHRSSNNALNK